MGLGVALLAVLFLPSCLATLYPTPQEIKFEGDYFTCDVSKRIHKSEVNDDYCDCDDGTDEPRTSACYKGKYYCQNVGGPPTLIHSAAFNDNRCDCCDGSDEAAGMCPNTCRLLAKDQIIQIEAQIALHKEAYSLISDDALIYMRDKKKKQANQKSLVDAGDDGEFAYLIGTKTEKKIKKAGSKSLSYVITHFLDVTQVEKKKSTVIGRWAGWEKSEKSLVGLYLNGEPCWNGIIRTCRVNFVCGIETDILEVLEPGMCEYQITLQTPGACRKDTLESLEKLLTRLKEDSEETSSQVSS